MMTLKQWTVGMVLYLGYLVIGAAFYYTSEHSLEAETRLNNRQARIEIFNLLNDYYMQPVAGDGPYIMQRLEAYCGNPVTNTTLDNDEGDGPYKWNYFNSIMFAITVTTTLGYGNLAPTSPHGRLWMILYALIGIPFTGILLATLGEFFSLVILRIQDRYKRQRIETRLGFITDIAMYIAMGIFTFIFLPTCIFVHVEQWSWSLSIYYSFVTVSTVGFGDYVAGQQPELVESEIWFTFYRVLIILWIIFGLGYYFMVLAYLTRAWRSKKVLQLEHKLAKSIKVTQSKMWQGVTKDLGYLRRVLNEVYLARVQPVYRDDEDYIRSTVDPLKRNSSAPDLSLYDGDPDDDDADPPAGVWRRRANSEAYCLSLAPRRVSDTDLQRIDRDATFRAASLIQPVDLLQHVVEALGSTSYVNEAGTDGFTDDEICASEGWCAVEKDDAERRPRASTVTETRIPIDDMHGHLAENGNAQWTWSGVPASRHIHELMRARQKRRNTSFHEEEVRLTPLKTRGLLDRWNESKQNRKAKSLGSLFLNNNATKRRGSLQANGRPPDYTQRNYKSHTHNSSPLSLYGDPDTDVDSILEETSIGEFLRALTNVHSRVIGDSHTLTHPRANSVDTSQHPPSLFNLFAPLHQQPANGVPIHRRFSLRRVSSPMALPGGGNRRPSLRSTSTTASSPMSHTNSDKASLTPPLGGLRRSSLRPTPLHSQPNSDISHQTSFTPPPGNIRRTPLYPTPLYSQTSSDIPYHPLFKPAISGTRRSSLHPGTPPPSYTPPYDGGRRSSLRPFGTSTSGSGRHQFTKQQPLRPRFKIGPYDKQSGEPIEEPIGARTRHQSS